MISQTSSSLLLFAKEKNYTICETIAKKYNLPEETFRFLAKHRNPDIKKIIARRDDLPEDLIITLANDDDYKVREAISDRDHLPKEIGNSRAMKDKQDRLNRPPPNPAYVIEI